MKRVLIAPLDWGLGHATRCVPIIRALLDRSCDVYVGGSGASLALLRLEFPSLKFIEFPGYDPAYSKNGSMVMTMIGQLPKFVRTISAEHEFLKGIVESEKIDAVISDNRYGCWSDSVPSVLITHQSNVLMPKRFGWFSPIVRFLIGRYIRRFTFCWIPDVEGQQNLSGEMTAGVSNRARFVGHLSRFKPRGKAEKTYDLLCIVSGPEPQRTRLEEILAGQLNAFKGRALLVRGLPSGGKTTLKTSATVFDFLTSQQLQDAIESSELIIARSGFSTVMDLSRLGGKAVFIPTPGQTEQEYLAHQLKSKGIAFSLEQEHFDLQVAMTKAKEFSGFIPDGLNHSRLNAALDELLLK